MPFRSRESHVSPITVPTGRRFGGVSFTQNAGEMIGRDGCVRRRQNPRSRKCLNRIHSGVRGRRFFTARSVSQASRLSISACAILSRPKVGMVFQDFESQLFSTNVCARSRVCDGSKSAWTAPRWNRRILPALRGSRTARLRASRFRCRYPAAREAAPRDFASVLAFAPVGNRARRSRPPISIPRARAEVFDVDQKIARSGLEPDRNRARIRGAAEQQIA